MNRRNLLKSFSIGVLGGSLGIYFQSLRAIANEEQGGIHWGYIGETGPNNWAHLSPDYQLCQMGTNQSPIELQPAVPANLAPLKINYKSSILRIINNGHTIQVNYAPGSSIEIDDNSYELIQFHFHHPSEHQIKGKKFPMELHLVHKNQSGIFTVLGVFLKEGQHNQALQSIWSVLPPASEPEKTIQGVTVDAEQLLPSHRSFERYFGSLTTPPCSEAVNWIVFLTPVEVSKQQIQSFASLFSLNARPTQKLNHRFLLQSNVT